MRNAFLAVVFVSVVSGCTAPKPYLINSTTWMATYRYTTSDSSGFDESKKAAVVYCKEYGKNAELHDIDNINEFTSAATFYCK